MNSSRSTWISVLAGGRSSRMGEDKRALRIAGETLIERACRVAQAALALGGGPGEVVISGAGAWVPDGIVARVIPDGTPDRGPLEAIRTVLDALAAHAKHVLFTPVDMPLLLPADLSRLLVEDGQLVHFSGYELPILVGTTRATRAVVETVASGPRRSIRALIDALPSAVVPANAAAMVNVNTPDEWGAFARSLEAK